MYFHHLVSMSRVVGNSFLICRRITQTLFLLEVVGLRKFQKAQDFVDIIIKYRDFVIFILYENCVIFLFQFSVCHS